MICKKCGKDINEYPCPFCGEQGEAAAEGEGSACRDASVMGEYLTEEAPAAEKPIQESYGDAMLQGIVPANESGMALGGTGRAKKRRKGLVIGLSIGAAVLAAAAVGYFFFFDVLSRFFLGDVNYAKLIHKNALSGVVYSITPDEPSLLGHTANAAAKGFVSGIKTAVSAVSYSGDDSAGAVIPDISGILLSALENIPDGKKLSMSSSVSVQPGDAGSILSFLTDIINGMSVDMAAARSGNTGMVSLGVSSKGESLGAAEIYTDGSGAVFTLPGISDTVFALPGSDTGSAAPEDRTYDPAEFKRLAREIGMIYISSFDKAKLTYVNSLEKSAEGGGITAAAAGKGVSVEIDSETLDATIAAIFDKLANDSYLVKYVTENAGISEEEYKKLLPSQVKTGCTLTYTHIYDGRNNALSTLIRLLSPDGAELLTVSCFGSGKDFAARVQTSALGSNVGARFIAKAANDTDGSAYAEVYAGDIQLGFNLGYSGVKKVEWLGRPTAVGTYTVKPANAEDFASTAAFLLGEAAVNEDVRNFTAELKNLVLTVALSLDGDTYSADTELSVGGAGSFGVRSRVTAGEAPDTIPASDAELNADTAGALGEDIIGWLGELAKRFPWGEAVDSVIDSAADKLIDKISDKIGDRISGRNDDALSDDDGSDAAAEEADLLRAKWNVTSVGSKLVSASGYIMQVEVTEDTVKIVMSDGDSQNYGSSYPAKYGMLENGKYGVRFYQDDAARDTGDCIGYIYTMQGVFAVMYDKGIGQRSYMMRDGMGVNVSIDKSGIKKDTAIDDITGIWQGTDFNGSPYIIAITPDMLVADILSPSSFMKLDGGDGYFAVCRYASGGKAGDALGKLYYSENDDALLMSRDADGAEAILIRIDDTYPSYPYLGEWTLTETNGIPIEKLAEDNGLSLADVAGDLEISPYFMITESKSGADAFIIVGGEKDGFTFEMTTVIGTCTYDDTDDTFTIVLSYIDSNDTYTMRYKRGRYEF